MKTPGCYRRGRVEPERPVAHIQFQLTCDCQEVAGCIFYSHSADSNASWRRLSGVKPKSAVILRSYPHRRLLFLDSYPPAVEEREVGDVGAISEQPLTAVQHHKDTNTMELAINVNTAHAAAWSSWDTHNQRPLLQSRVGAHVPRATDK